MNNIGNDWNSYFDAFSGVYTSLKVNEEAQTEKVTSSVREDEVVERNEYENVVSEKLEEPAEMSPLASQDDNSENVAAVVTNDTVEVNVEKPETDAEFTEEEKETISRGRGRRK